MKRIFNGDSFFKYGGVPISISMIGISIIACLEKFSIISEQKKLILVFSLIAVCIFISLLNSLICHYSAFLNRVFEFLKRHCFLYLNLSIYFTLCLIAITPNLYLDVDNLKLLMSTTWTILGIDLALITLWFSTVNKMSSFLLKRLKDPKDNITRDNVSPFISKLISEIICTCITISLIVSASMGFFAENKFGNIYLQCNLVMAFYGTTHMLISIIIFCLLPIALRAVVIKLFSQLKENDNK